MISIDSVAQSTNLMPMSEDSIFRVRWSDDRTTHYSLVVRSCTTRECRWQNRDGSAGRLCPIEVDQAINAWEDRELCPKHPNLEALLKWRPTNEADARITNRR